MTTTDAPNESVAKDTPPTLRARVDHSLVVAVYAIAILGDILAFNQLATQSPIDADLMLLIFTVGFAGLLEGARRIILGGDATARVIGIVIVAIASAAILAWTGQWATEFQGLLVIAAAVVIGLLSTSLLWRQRHGNTSEATQFAGLLALGQAIIAVWFGVLAITSLGS